MWFILVLVIVLYFLFRYYKAMNYWHYRGISQISLWRCVKNLFANLFRTKQVVDLLNSSYSINPDAKYMGMYQFATPALMIRDVELIKQVTVKNFDSFMNHRTIITDDIDSLFGKNLVSLKGQKWKDMRSILSPAFTSSKMRMIYVLITDCAEQFTEYFLKEAKKENGLVTVEMKDIFTRYANDVIGTAAFGIKTNSLEEKENEFYLAGKTITSFTFISFLKVLGFLMSPRLMKFFKISFMTKKVTQFFTDLILTTIRTREEQGIIRPDMIHLLIEAKKGRLKHEAVSEGTGFATVNESDIGKTESDFEFTNQDIISQAFLFFLAGYDTASTVMSFMAYELAVQPEIQTRLQKEIDDVVKNKRVDYENVLKMKYLDMVVSEALRKWPPAILTERLCEKSYKIETPNDNELSPIIESGTTIWIPVYSIHHDEKYYPDPERFDPERFSDENKHNIIPFSYLPFGSGPRNCIGSRFALLEIKILLVHFLAKFSFTVVEKTQIPIQLSKKYFNLTAEKGIWIGLKLRNE